jgi:hypothetical protein
MLRLTFTILLLVPVATLFAEINPMYYREMQEKAPERLRIRPTDVSRDWYFWRRTRKVKVEAEVISVVKSAAGLSKGNKVYFEYETYEPEQGWAGPRPMPLLEEGVECDFFGEKTGVNKKKGVILEPGARGYSFDSLL